MKRLYKARLGSQKEMEKSFLSNEADAHFEGGGLNMAEGFFAGGKNYRAEIYKAKHEDDYERNGLAAVLDLVHDEYVFTHKRIKLNTCAFLKLFCSWARCLEDMN